MKTKLFKHVSIAALMALLAVIALGTAAFAQGPTRTTPNHTFGFGRGNGGMGMGMRGMGSARQTLPANTIRTPLTDAERAALSYMREEEKLAHDVYATLYTKYGSFVFNNIAQGELRHTDAIKILLDRYGIADPAAGKAVGEFSDPQLQALYNLLVAQANISLSAAMQVGVTIEQTDIADLKTHLTETSKTDIQRVYNNLLRASQNHLRAFERFQ